MVMAGVNPVDEARPAGTLGVAIGGSGVAVSVGLGDVVGDGSLSDAPLSDAPLSDALFGSMMYTTEGSGASWPGS